MAFKGPHDISYVPNFASMSFPKDVPGVDFHVTWHDTRAPDPCGRTLLIKGPDGRIWALAFELYGSNHSEKENQDGI